MYSYSTNQTQNPSGAGKGSSRRPLFDRTWLMMAPGVMLILFSLTILIWPQLLAYLVASVMLMAGVVLTGWAWSARRWGRAMGRQAESVVYYEVRQ